MLFLTLVAGTFVSEDLTSIFAGLLIQEGRIGPGAAIAACALGIWIGDLGLWAVGRWAGRRALQWRPVRRAITPAREVRFAEWFSCNAGPLILSSRFLPGTRLPLYVASGALGGSFVMFAGWTAVGVVVWTPVVVALAAGWAATWSNPLAQTGASEWVSRVVLLGVLLTGWRVTATLSTSRGRQRLVAAVSRLWRWEFWPMWLFYAPVAMWLAWLTVRHRGLGAISAANPGMPDGGIVGESKQAILARLPAEWTIPSFVVEPGVADDRVWQFLGVITSRQWTFPLVFKPDVGQRGVGVRILRTLEEARCYLAHETTRVLVQPYHRGPCEAGVFYYRLPGQSRGRILSITDKHFPSVVGDSHSTLEDLIWADSRLRMQAATFLARHAASRDRIVDAGERLPLAIAGNHAQGTLFRDGAHLMTPALEARIDEIAWSYDGFCVGRFDIRYGDVEGFKAGEDLAIVELNGATAECTNIYDPDGSLLAAYRQLFRQWSLVFAIGAANRERGAPPSSIRRILNLLRAHLAATPAYRTSD